MKSTNSTDKGKYAALLREAVLIGGGGALLFACLHFGPALLKQKVKKPADSHSLAIGEKLQIPSTLHDSKRVVLAASKYDKFSMQNLSFHQALFTELIAKKIPVAVIVPDAASASFYSEALHFPREGILVTDLRKLGVIGTPTILELDARDNVAALWQGLVPESRQKTLLRVMETSEHVLVQAHRQPSLQVIPQTGKTEEVVFAEISGERAPVRLSTTQLSRLRDGESLDEVFDQSYPGSTPQFVRIETLDSLLPPHLLVDIQPSSSYRIHHLPGSLNIPQEALSSRIADLKRQAREVVIDCAQVTTTVCDTSTDALLNAGLTQVASLDRGARRSSCAYEPAP